MFGHIVLLFACFTILCVSVDCPFVHSSAAIFHQNVSYCVNTRNATPNQLVNVNCNGFSATNILPKAKLDIFCKYSFVVIFTNAFLK